MTLGLRLRREFFDRLVGEAVPPSCGPDYPGGREAWSAALESSEVRLQWDPDHSPSGAKLARRAIQLGLRGRMLEALAGPELLEVVDLTDFVGSQRRNASEPHIGALRTPIERVYIPGSTRCS